MNSVKGCAEMTEKELKKMNRKQLLELLLRQTERADALQKKLEETEEKLSERRLIESEAGSIAEASLKLNGVFEAADAAATQYLDSIRKVCENQALLVRRAEDEAKKRAEKIVEETQQRMAEREAEFEKRLQEISDKVHRMYDPKEMLGEFTKDFTVMGKDAE